jgi:WD40 repeat protein
VAIGTAGDRAIIASASQDETVRLWDALTGEPIGDPLTGHTSAVWAVAIGTAGDRAIIASASHDETVRLWNAQTHELVQVIDMFAPPHALTLDGSGVLYVGAGIAICRFEPRFEHAIQT